jgi:hypothetical protein
MDGFDTESHPVATAFSQFRTAGLLATASVARVFTGHKLFFLDQPDVTH